MKYPISCIAAILCMICCISCEFRDPEREFEALSSTAFEPQVGRDKAKEYINHFKKNKNAHIQEVRAIRDEYATIVGFALNDYTDCASLVADAREIDSELSNSQSSGVRTAWSTLYKNKRNRTQQMQMERLGEADFSPALSQAAREICNARYLTWRVESVEEVSIGPAELIEDGTAKCCSAEYMVFLRGSVLGLRTYNTKVSARGKYSFDSNGYMHFTLEDSNIIDGPVTVDEAAQGIMQVLPFLGD